MSVVSSARRKKSWQIADEIASLLDVARLEREQLGVKLRELARARGLGSDEEAARLIGVSYRQYQRWLSGESEPRASSLKLIAERFDVALAELLDQPDPSQLERIEEMLTHQGDVLDVLALALEAELGDRFAAAVERARRQAPGRPRAEDRRGQGGG